MGRLHFPEEFLPLPYFPWNTRPLTVPLDADEAATAIYLAHGDINRAAALLKVTPARFGRAIRKSGRLQLLLSDFRSRREG